MPLIISIVYYSTSMIPVIVHLPNTGVVPIAARAAPAWLGSSVLLVAIFGAVLGLLGVVILILILYIYKQWVTMSIVLKKRRSLQFSARNFRQINALQFYNETRFIIRCKMEWIVFRTSAISDDINNIFNLNMYYYYIFLKITHHFIQTLMLLFDLVIRQI